MEKMSVHFSEEKIRWLKDIAMAKKLKGADILDEYTPSEISESFNGAGSSADSETNRRIMTFLMKKVLPAVMIHDMAYRKGGSKRDFARVNQELKDNIIALTVNDGDRHGRIHDAWWNFVARKAKEYSDEKGAPGWGKA